MCLAAVNMAILISHWATFILFSFINEAWVRFWFSVTFMIVILFTSEGTKQNRIETIAFSSTYSSYFSSVYVFGKDSGLLECDAYRLCCCFSLFQRDCYA